MARALKHQMLDQVCDAAIMGRFITKPGAIGHPERNTRASVILFQKNPKAVPQLE